MLLFIQMPHKKRSGRSAYLNSTGGGVVNSLINRLPFELHIPGYQFCGPGTKIIKRIKRGDQGINPLDAACKRHDLSYLHNQDNLSARHRADYELEQRAWERVKSGTASASEKAAAWLVTNIMKTKQRFGMGVSSQTAKLRRKKGLKNKKIAFGSALRRPIRDELFKAGGRKLIEKNLVKASKIAVAAARKSLKSIGGKRKIRSPRIIPIPKVGGLLPLIPIFEGLSALGSLAGGVAGVVRAIKTVKKANAEKIGATLHLHSKGSGLYLKPYRSGLGLFMNNNTSSKNY